jgi:hypothetical protein
MPRAAVAIDKGLHVFRQPASRPSHSWFPHRSRIVLIAGPHDDVAIDGELDRFHRIFRGLGSPKKRDPQPADGGEPCLWAWQSDLTKNRGTNRNALKILYHIAASGAAEKCAKSLFHNGK